MDTDCNTDCEALGEESLGIQAVVTEVAAEDNCPRGLTSETSPTNALLFAITDTSLERRDGSTGDVIQTANLAATDILRRLLISSGSHGTVKGFVPAQVLGTFRVVSRDGSIVPVDMTYPGLIQDNQIDEDADAPWILGGNDVTPICGGKSNIINLGLIPTDFVLPAINAVADTAETDFETDVNIDVLTNDTITGTPIVTITIQPVNGTAVVEIDGTITYTPDTGFDGADPFTYQIEDEYGQTDTAVVTVTVAEEVIPEPEEPTCFDGDILYRYDASLLTGANDDPVTTWPDTSGNARDATQANASQRPLLKTASRNGLNTVEFDGVNDALISANFATGGSINAVVFMICKVDATSVVFSHKANGGATHGTGMLLSSTPQAFAMLEGAARGAVSSPALGSWVLLRMEADFTGGINRVYALYANGSLIDSAASYSVGTTANAPMRLGHRNNGFGEESFLDGSIGEIVFIANFDEGCADEWETFLKDKWGFTY